MANKIGRNELCPCGSGKKYKKCCLSFMSMAEDDDELFDADDSEEEDENDVYEDKFFEDDTFEGYPLIKTLTGELFQPARLYYVVHDRKKLESIFEGLACVSNDADKNQWFIEYRAEAGSFDLMIKPYDVPRVFCPLVLATVSLKNENTLLIDVNSVSRASSIMTFMDKYMGRYVAELTEFALYNDFIERPFLEKEKVDYDEIFDEKNMKKWDLEEISFEKNLIINELATAMNEYESDEKIALIFNEVLKKTENNFFHIWKLPARFYEAGTELFLEHCKLKRMVIFRNYLAKKNYLNN